MGGPSFGAQVACIVQFVVLMTLLGPILSICSTTGACELPPAQYQLYFGTNGIASITNSSFSGNIVSPLISQANSSSGFGAAGSLQQFSGLAFIYGAMGLAWKSFTNFPSLLYLIFTSVGSSISFLPFALASICSVGILAYILISDFFKVLSGWQKTDFENIGS